ncbi:MAG TPA: hypothetical protein VFY20_08435, partial [Gemmatimonadales bacterium]|nr:hypothetical protein [Gemmatimonadales bacterium]
MTCLNRAVLAFAIACVLAVPAWGQQPRRAPALKPKADSTLIPAVEPARDSVIPHFAPSQVPLEADRTFARVFELSAVGATSEADAVMAGARILADSLANEDRVSALVQSHLLTRRGLGDLNLTWVSRSRQVQDWRRSLQSSVAKVDSANAELDRLGILWRETLRVQDSTVSSDVHARTQQVLDEIARVDSVLASRSNQLVRAELELSNAGTEIAKELQNILLAQNEMRRNLLRIESPPLWESLRAAGGLSLDGRGGIATAVPELRWFVQGNLGRIVLHLLATLLCILIVLANRERVRQLASASETLADHVGVVKHPVSAVLLVSATCALWLYPRAPLAFYDVVILLAALPLLRLVPDLIPADLHPSARIAVGMLVLQRTVTVGTVGTAPFRLLQLGLSLLGAFFLWKALQPGGPLRVQQPSWRQQLRRLAWLLLSAFVVAIGSNVIGNVSLADVINSGVALSLFLALLVFAVTQVIDIAASALIKIGAEESRYLAERGHLLERVLVSIIKVVSIVIWIAVSLSGFLLWQPAQDAILALLGASLTIGELTISVSMVASFLLVLFLGTQLARLLSGVIELDVMGRMDLRRGVAVTVGSLLRYALIGVAFLLALA